MAYRQRRFIGGEKEVEIELIIDDVKIRE